VGENQFSRWTRSPVDLIAIKPGRTHCSYDVKHGRVTLNLMLHQIIRHGAIIFQIILIFNKFLIGFIKEINLIIRNNDSL